MKKQELSQIQNVLSQRLQKNVQPVSCLYSDHLYKSNHKGLIQKMQMQKFRTLYQHQQKEKLDILHNFDLARKKIRCLQLQKQTLTFAYKALEVKIRHDKVKQSKNKTKIQKKSKENQKIINITQFKRNSKRQNSSVILNFHHQSIQNHNQIENHPIAFTSPKIQPERHSQRSILHQHSQIMNQSHQYQQSEYKVIQQESQIKEKKMLQEIQNKQIIIKEKNEKIQQLYETIQKNKKQQIEQIILYENKINDLENNTNILKTQIIQKQSIIQNCYCQIQKLQSQIQQTQKKYQQKEMKQQHQVKLLKKFGQQLKINDSKIKQFMKQQFGEQIQGAFVSERAAYKEKISYLLHLAKKKQDLYEGLIKDLKERNRQNLFRIEILQSKLDVGTKIQQKILMLATNKQIDKLYEFIKHSFQ